MRQRGRPRHPDLLTPREWEVLSLVREGLSNREIGDRLGVSRDGIKYHISQILPKLGVSSREEAAEWQPPVPATAPQTTGLATRFSRITRVGLIGTAGALLAGLVALGGAVAYSELSGVGSNDASVDALGGPPTASPDPIPTPSPDHTPAPPFARDNALGSVAYVRDGNLWVLNLDTGDDRMLVQRDVALTFGTTAQDLTMLGPEWSVDGEWICFGIRNAAVNDATSIWVVRANDGLLEGNGYGRYWEWSPTDLVLAGGFSGGDLSRPVGSFPPGYAQYMSTIANVNFGQGEARWSPDGRLLAVPDATGARLDPENSDDASAPYHIKLIDPEIATGPTVTPTDNVPGVSTIFTADSGASAPMLHSWSPDGKYLLFWTGPGNAPAGEMTLLPVDNPGEARTLAPAPVVQSSAAWSPDGSTLAVVDVADGSLNGVVRIVRIDGSFDDTFGVAQTVDVAWSPNSSKVAFSQAGHIRYVSLRQGEGGGELTNDPAYIDRYPQWSSDGSRILLIRLDANAVAAGVAAEAELWLMNADGSNPYKVGDLAPVNASALNSDAPAIDWSRFFSWHRPTGIEPLRTAPPASGFPTPLFTPEPAVSATTPAKPQ